MFWNSHLERVRQTFAEQFEADGNELFYRKHGRGRSILVTEAERDSFVADFGRRLRYAIWAVAFLTISLVVLPIFFAPAARIASTQLIWLGTGFAVLASFLVTRWAWNAPARELRSRISSAPARSRDEVRRIAFGKLTYGSLASAAIGAISVPYVMSSRVDVLHGWGRLWLVVAGALILLVAVQALRKWNHERS